jgi:hypothetical protein
MPASAFLTWLTGRMARHGSATPAQRPAPSLDVSVLKSGTLAPPMPSSVDPAAADIVSRFAHDVASPLTMVIAVAEMLLEEAERSDRGADDIRDVLSAAQEISSAVQELRERIGRIPRAATGS